MRRYTILLIAIIFSCIATTAKDRPIKVALLADLHITPGNYNDSTMDSLVDDINSEKYDLVIVAGDITNMGSDKELECAYNHLKRISHRQIITHGNHETTWSESGGKDFKKYFGHNGCTTKSVGDYLFVAYPAGPFVKMADGTAQDGQRLVWVEKQLKKAGRRRIVSICHYPLNNDLTNREQITELMNRYRVHASLCGHYHKPQLMNFDSIPGILGRSLMLPDGKNKTYGYSVLTFNGDSIHVADKLIGEPATHRYTVCGYRDSLVNSIECAPKTESLFNGGFTAEQILTDNAAIYTAAQHSEGLLYYGNSAGQVKAYDVQKQQTKWCRNFNEPIYSTPIIYKELLIVATLSDGIVALNKKTGKTVWRNKDYNTFIGNGIVANDYLYIGTLGTMLKIECSSGKIIWANHFGYGHPQGRPTVANGKLVFGAWDCYLYCIDCNSGKELWRWNNGSKNRLYSPGHVIPRVGNNRVMIVAPDRYMTCIDLEQGREIWRAKVRKVRESTGISNDGTVFYAKTMDGQMVAIPIEADSYTELWCTDCGWGYDHNFCPLTATDSVIYMANRRGKVAAVDKNGKIECVGKFANSAANDLRADSNGDIWVSFIEGTIWRLSALK